MGYYGKTKAEHMARSILPSTKCVRKDRRFIHKRTRAAVRASTHKACLHYEQGTYYAMDIDAPETRGQMERLVSDRREADKVSHFITWVEKTTAKMSVEDRRGYIKKLMPKGVIGEHALGHLRRVEGFELNPFAYSWRRAYSKPRVSLYSIVTAIIANPSNVAALNQAVRRRLKVLLNLMTSTELLRLKALPVEHPDDVLKGVSDLPRWWRHTRGLSEKAVREVAEAIHAGRFEDCWVEGVFFARCAPEEGNLV